MNKLISKRIDHQNKAYASGYTKLGVLGISVALLVVASIAAAFSMPGSSGSRWMTPSDEDIRFTVAFAGLTPEHLAASGVTASEAESIATRARTHILDTAPELPADATDLIALRQRVSSMERDIRARRGDATVADLNAARSLLATAEARVSTAKETLRQAALSGLSAEKGSLIGHLCVAEHAGIVPVECRVITDHSEAEALALREALAASRTAQHAGIDLDSGSQDVLDAASGRAEVQTAEAGLANLDAIQTAFLAGLASE